MVNPDELASVCKEKSVSILSNAISICMIENDMTLEYLDEAYENVKDLYRRNALMPKCKG